VPSEERGGEKGLGFDESPWAAVDKDGKCAISVCGRHGNTVPGEDR
jgi:hypothetical protein